MQKKLKKNYDVLQEPEDFLRNSSFIIIMLQNHERRMFLWTKKKCDFLITVQIFFRRWHIVGMAIVETWEMWADKIAHFVHIIG